MTDFTQAELLRYSRQCALPQIGVAGQKKLRDTAVLCVGAGGIGSPVLYYLAAAGIGKIGIIDDDQVELSNLQRQILFQNVDCGQSKAAQAKQRILALNDQIQVQAYTERLNSANVFELLADYPIIVDGSDNYATRYLLSDACAVKKRMLVAASLLQFSGQLLTFQYANNDQACYRCLYPAPPPAGLVPNCAEAGVIGAVAGTLGSLAATQVIKLALDLPDALRNQLLVFNGLSCELKKYTYHKRVDCPLCSNTVLFDELPRYPENSCSLPLAQITPQQLQQQLQQKQKVLVIDVRADWERAIYAIPDSMHIPVEKFDQLDISTLALDQHAMVALYCKSGVRSAKAARLLQAKGVDHVYSLTGGIIAWAAQINQEKLTY